jgi:hypothetical protein
MFLKMDALTIFWTDSAGANTSPSLGVSRSKRVWARKRHAPSRRGVLKRLQFLASDVLSIRLGSSSRLGFGNPLNPTAWRLAPLRTSLQGK